jgi:chemotaxis protein CheZ
MNTTCTPETLGLSEADMAHMLGLMRQSEALVGLMDDFFGRLDTRRSQELVSIAAFIAEAKSELRAIRPRGLPGHNLNGANQELDAIVRDTEDATNIILGAAEAILELDAAAADLKDQVDDQVMRIFEACSFQDITGQRVSKIIALLEKIEACLSGMADTLGEVMSDAAPLNAEAQRRRDLMLNGPALNGPEIAQDAIDAMFA